MIIKFGTGGDEQDHVSTPKSIRSMNQDSRRNSIIRMQNNNTSLNLQSNYDPNSPYMQKPFV